MNKTIYLTVNPSGDVNLLKRYPTKPQRQGLVVVAVTLEIPDSVFRIPLTVVNVEIPEPAREDVVIEVDYVDE